MQKNSYIMFQEHMTLMNSLKVPNMSVYHQYDANDTTYQQYILVLIYLCHDG